MDTVPEVAKLPTVVFEHHGGTDGRVTVNGVEIANVERVTIEAEADGDWPIVTLRIIAVDGVKVTLPEAVVMAEVVPLEPYEPGDTERKVA